MARGQIVEKPTFDADFGFEIRSVVSASSSSHQCM